MWDVPLSTPRAHVAELADALDSDSSFTGSVIYLVMEQKCLLKISMANLIT